MIKMESALFGELEIAPEQIINFPHGIPGFENKMKFVLHEPDPTLPFSYLLSLEDAELHFMLVDPFVFYRDYEFELSQNAQEELHIETPEEVTVRGIVSIRDQLEQATVNLLAPLVINGKKALGQQIVLHDTPYSTRHPLFTAAQTAE